VGGTRLADQPEDAAAAKRRTMLGGTPDMSDPFDRNILFARMIGLLTQQELDSLAYKTVAVAGAGGVGFTHAEAIVREGIGRMRISDFDVFDPINMGRQFGCSTLTVGREKAEVLEERLMTVNPALELERFGGLDEANVARFLDGADLACDAIDYFHVAPHRMMHREARKRGVPVVFCGPQGFGCTLHLFEPDHMSFDEFFDFHDDQSDLEQMRNWGMGIGPTHLYRHYLPHRNLDFEKQTGSVVSAVCLLSTALVAAVALRRLLNQEMFFKPVPHVYHLDLVMGRFEEVHIPEGVRGIKEEPKKYMR
jgi:molybdopterin/thiamine biosynthesis adenylyltransferase